MKTHRSLTTCLITLTASSLLVFGCSGKNRVQINEDGIVEDTNTQQNRLELKSSPGYTKNYGNYTVVANVYKDHKLNKECAVSKSDYCGNILGYRYCVVYDGPIPSPQELDAESIPTPMIKTRSKFSNPDICNKSFEQPTLEHHFKLMSLFNPSKLQSIVLESDLNIVNRDVLNHGSSKSSYYTSPSCYAKSKNAFITDADYLDNNLSNYHYFRQKTLGSDVLYEIEEKTTTYYKLSGYDCIPVKGHKLTETNKTYLGYGYAEIDDLMKMRTAYCQSMCKSYDEEGKSHLWETELDSTVTPISLLGVSPEPPSDFPAPAAAVPTASNEAAAPTAAAPSSTNTAIPALIPEPEITTPPEERLAFKKSIKTKKGALEYLIFNDKELNTPCYIAVHNNNPKALDDNRYCIPFSGNDKDLTHPMVITKTASQYENYTYCAANISPDKHNIPGLAGFFKAFSPEYYASSLNRFINDPFEIHKPQTRRGTKQEYTDTSYYYHLANSLCEDANVLLRNPFITETEYKKYNLKPGDVFLTASAAKGEKVLHQYWQVMTGLPEPVCICEWEVYDGGGSGGCDDFEENIVQVKDLSSKETYEALMPQIVAGMPARDRYCEAVNTALINEARAGKWARVDNSSPLMKKK